MELLQGANCGFDVADVEVEIVELVDEDPRGRVGLDMRVVEIELRFAESYRVVLLEDETLAAVEGEVEIGFLVPGGCEGGCGRLRWREGCLRRRRRRLGGDISSCSYMAFSVVDLTFSIVTG